MPPRLQSIELQGFKSFARPTKLVFGDRLTAIVGPNGAGKSNIVDALRWVLGEPSLRLLRAKRVEDLIFAGTDRRPRAGLAQVTVVFNNEDGWLPVDFTEVALTRRVDREGRSEIFLNGRRVRLRDVKELLAQAGLAEGGYTFIGQGMVDQVLQLRPEERRRLLEEAAGIGLYRQRREEALRRLDVTRQNLARVEDLLAELEPRLERLERRVARMQEAQKVQEELRGLLGQLYTLQWHRWSQEVDRARKEVEEARTSLDTARKTWQRRRREREEHESTLRALRQEQQHLQQRLRETEGAWEQALQEQARLQEALQELRERLLALEREEQEAKTRATLAQARLQEAQDDVARLQTALDEARTRHREARTQLNEQRARREEARQRLRQLRREWESLRQRKTELEAQLRALERRKERVEEELQALQAGLQPLKERETAAAKRLESVRERLEQARRDRDEARAQVELGQARVQEQDTQRRQAEEVRSRLQAQLEEVRARLEVLKQAEARQMGYGQGAREVAQAAREAGVLVGLIAGLFQVDEAYEKALAAALGPWADAVVVKHVAPQLMDMARRAPEQVRLLALNEVTFTPSPPPPKDPDWLGWASDFVRTDASVRPVVYRLLSRVGLVRHAEAARRLRAKVSDDVVLVTLEGEVFYPRGPIALGKPQARALFQRTRERQHLQEQLGVLQERYAQAETALQEAQRAWQQAQEALEEAQREWQQAEVLLDDLRREADEARNAWEQVRQALHLQQQRLDERTKERAALMEEMARLREDLQRTQAQCAEAEGRVRDQEKRLRQFALDDLLAEVAYWERQEQALARDLAQAQERQRQAQQTLEEAQRQLAAARERRQALQDRGQDLALRLQEHRKQAEVWAQKVADLRNAWTPLEIQLQEAEARYEAMRNEEWQARQAVRERESAYQEALMRLQRAQSRRASLLRRMREERLLTPGATAEGSGFLPLPGLFAEQGQRPSIPQVPLEVLEEQVRALRQKWKRLGPVVPEILQEHEELSQRITFLRTQVADLRKAETDLLRLVDELDTLMERAFRRTFERVQKEFQSLFTRLFGGGKARLVLTNNNQQESAGVDIEVRLPGKRTQRLALLSGGERSLTAVALIFALLKVSPTPFCVLDEVDAMLDESNVGRYLEVLHEFSRDTQFVLITHHQLTVQAAQVLYGITLDDDGVSQVLSLRLEDVPEWLNHDHESQETENMIPHRG